MTKASDNLVGANGQPVELLTIGGRTVEVDAEVAPIVAALNAAGIETVASCSGHGSRLGNIALRDGRELIIARDFAEARRIEKPQATLLKAGEALDGVTAVLIRYRKETPPGHSPHMICHVADTAIEKALALLPRINTHDGRDAPKPSQSEGA
jgi:hypothetical protein